MGRALQGKWIGIIALISVASAAVAVRLVIAHAEPILRTRVIDTLSNRFHSKVELASFHVSLVNGIEVSGDGLKIFGTADPNPYEPGVQALIGVQEFRFQTALLALFHSPMHVGTVYVKGLELNIPPKENRREMTNMSSRAPKMTIFVDRFICEDAKLVINTSKPGKLPLEFAISDLKMKDIGPGQPFQFNATLVNPKPVGDIDSNGLFGPWQQDSPRETPVQGNYSFTRADLSTIKGIGGILSSTGEYSGTLSNIAVHGKTDTPDFRVATSGHPVPLHTEFHAVVDGTSGDTYLRPVNATFLHSSFTANGSVVRVSAPNGHDIELDVAMDDARIEDLLRLGVRTDPSIMSGPVEMKTRLSLRPGDCECGGQTGVGRHISCAAWALYQRESAGETRLVESAQPGEAEAGAGARRGRCPGRFARRVYSEGWIAVVFYASFSYSRDARYYDWRLQLRRTKVRLSWKGLAGCEDLANDHRVEIDRSEACRPVLQQGWSRHGNPYQNHRHAIGATLWSGFRSQRRARKRWEEQR